MEFRQQGTAVRNVVFELDNITGSCGKPKDTHLIALDPRQSNGM